MCGIVGYTGYQPAQKIVVDSLKKLEYRGYDSSGIATKEDKLVICKKEGPIANMESILPSFHISRIPNTLLKFEAGLYGFHINPH